MSNTTSLDPRLDSGWLLTNNLNFILLQQFISPFQARVQTHYAGEFERQLAIKISIIGKVVTQ